MKRCPSCQDEFDDRVAVCPSCGTMLREITEEEIQEEVYRKERKKLLDAAYCTILKHKNRYTRRHVYSDMKDEYSIRKPYHPIVAWARGLNIVSELIICAFPYFFFVGCLHLSLIALVSFLFTYIGDRIIASCDFEHEKIKIYQKYPDPTFKKAESEEKIEKNMPRGVLLIKIGIGFLALALILAVPAAIDIVARMKETAADLEGSGEQVKWAILARILDFLPF